MYTSKQYLIVLTKKLCFEFLNHTEYTNTKAELYKYTKDKVLTTNGETEIFIISKDVLHGDTFYPSLCVITLDYVIRKAIEGK